MQLQTARLFYWEAMYVNHTQDVLKKCTLTQEWHAAQWLLKVLLQRELQSLKLLQTAKEWFNGNCEHKLSQLLPCTLCVIFHMFATTSFWYELLINSWLLHVEPERGVKRGPDYRHRPDCHCIRWQSLTINLKCVKKNWCKIKVISFFTYVF